MVRVMVWVRVWASGRVQKALTAFLLKAALFFTQK
jgi:hypothetical protein